MATLVGTAITVRRKITKMKDTECVEILEDGTVYYFDLEVCNREAEKAIEELHMKQDVIPNFDYTSSIFTIFISSIQILSNSGWTTDELLQEVLNHAD
jgi:hypothetical protein